MQRVSAGSSGYGKAWFHSVIWKEEESSRLDKGLSWHVTYGPESSFRPRHRKGCVVSIAHISIFPTESPEAGTAESCLQGPLFLSRCFSWLSLRTPAQGPFSQGLSGAKGFNICRGETESFFLPPSLSPQPTLPSTTGSSSGVKGTRPEEAGSQANTLNTHPAPALFLHRSRPGLL